MPSIDWPLERLRDYRPSLPRPADFDAFWQTTLAASAGQPINLELIPYHLAAPAVEAFAVRLDGFADGGAPPRLAGWYVRPKAGDRLPGMVFFHGYSQRGARPLDLLALAGQGFCCMSLDCRGQNGDSEETLGSAPGGHAAGWLTRGIRRPKAYYYRYAFADAARAVEALAGRGEVDAARVGVTGGSQGGALAVAAAALNPRVALCVSENPFLCDFPRAVQLAPTEPYQEIARFLRMSPELMDEVFATLAYHDVALLAGRVACPTLMSICLWDDVCPPSASFAAYNAVAGPKEVAVYPFHRHETPDAFRERAWEKVMDVLGTRRVETGMTG